LIVIDASAVIELLINSPAGARVADCIFRDDVSIHAPHILDLEVAQVLRKYVFSKEMTAQRASEAIDDFSDLSINRYPHFDFLARIWQLRSSMTSYDAAYVSLAEALDATLLTCDAKLRRSHGHSVRTQVV
jgi:predicted nucleic acid-binding protein